MNINPNDPRTWNRPGWANNSCYANAALWALLYNDIYINLIKTTPIKEANNTQQSDIKIALNTFYKNVHNYQQEKNVYKNTKIIREALSTITNDVTWLNSSFDPSEFLRAISNIYNISQINNTLIVSQNNPEIMFLPIINLPFNYTIKNNNNNNIVITDNDILTGGIAQQLNYNFNACNGLILEYPKPGVVNQTNAEANFRDITRITIDKWYSIGQYKLYAFLHWQGGYHYACYFEFNDHWYIFDDTGNGSKGSIINADMRNISLILSNQSFLIFYKIDNNLDLNSNSNVLCSTHFNYGINQHQQEASSSSSSTSSTSSTNPIIRTPPTPTPSPEPVRSAVWQAAYKKCMAETKGGTRKKCKKKKYNKCRRTRKGRKTRKIIKGKKKKKN